MNILVTGGTGFLGKRLVQQLAKKHKVYVYSRHKHEDSIGILIEGDIRDKESLEAAFRNKIDVVYHLAISLNESDPDMFEINTKGTRNVAELAKKHRVKQIIYMGSSGVLGETPKPAKEDMPYNPKTLYEKSKMEGEKIIKQCGAPYTIVRTTIIIGPNLIWTQIFGAARKGYPMLGDGDNYFHLAYVEDVVRMLLIVLENKKALNQTFHAATKDTPTYYEVYKIICEELCVKMTKKKVPLALAYTASYIHTIKSKLRGKQPSLIKSKSSIDRLVRNRIISIEKAKRVLGFEPKFSTREAIRET